MIFGMRYLFEYRKKHYEKCIRLVLFQWVGEEAEGGDSGSRDCDYDCDCVVEWWGGAKIA